VAVVRRFLAGLLATIGALTLLSILAVGIGAWWVAGRLSGPPLPASIVLVADLREELPEAEAPALVPGLPRLERRPTVSDVVLALNAAGGDPRVKGMVARLDDTGHGLAVAQELRDAVAKFRATGRFAVAHAETFGELGPGNEGYYLATSFERVDLQPVGLVGLTGLGAEVPSAAGLLANIGVTFEVARRAEYKTALETVSEREITPANREMLGALLDDLSRQLAEGVAAGRRLDPAAVARLIDGGPYTAGEALSAGLVDGVRHLDETLGAALAQAGEGARAVPLGAYRRSGLPEPDEAASSVAFVRGVGTIRRGEGGVGRDIAADDTAQALADAVRDPDIRAILLRLDTGGGSAVASETIARQVRRAVAAGKPVVVSMGNTAASGGYWIAAEASTLVAQPATLTGSIGVVAGKPVLDGLWERLGVNWERVTRGANADIWSVNDPYTPAGRARIEAVLDAIYADFKAKVGQGRGLDAAQVEAVARGRVWTGAQAKQLGLVDRLGGWARPWPPSARR
jgi:protease-4